MKSNSKPNLIRIRRYFDLTEFSVYPFQPATDEITADNFKKKISPRMPSGAVLKHIKNLQCHYFLFLNKVKLETAYKWSAR